MATELTKVVFPTTDYIDLNKYRLLTNNDFDTINVTELNAGDLIVTGVGRFTNGLYGNLIGNANSATQVNNNLKIQLNGGTTEGTNQFTYNGSTAKSLNITKSSIGLGNVENKSSATIRGELTSTNVTGALGFTPLNAALKGANSGVAELDSAGKVPSSQLPSFVDDVLEYASLSNFPTTGESGKIYVAIDTNKTYRWGGSAYAEISPSLALGTTSTTAYYGDKGKVAYDHATETRLTTATASGLYKVASTKEGHIASLTSVVKSDITALGIPGSDTNTTYSLSASGESVVLTGSDSSTSTADLSSAFANYTPYKGNLTSIIGSASPASAMKTYWENNDNIKPTSVNTAYNTAGQEYAFLLSKGGSNQYGAVIRWGYGTKYFEMLRKYGSTWKDDDWVKMDAGYADTAGSATSATTASKLGSSNVGSATQPIYLSAGTATACTYTLGKSVPSDAVFTDTKNTTGATDTSSKIYLVGATSQTANPQTYSDNEIFATSGVLTTKSVQVGGGAATMEYDATTKSIDFVFAS